LLLQILLWQKNKPNFIDYFGTPGHALTYALIFGATFTLFINPHLWNSVIPGGWSIQAEVGHYLLFPFLKKFGILPVSLVLIIVNISTWSISKSVPNDDLNSAFSQSGILVGSWLRLGLYNTFTFFLIGIIFSYVYKEFRGWSFSSQTYKHKALDSLVFASLLVSLVIVPCPFGNSLEALFYLVSNLIVGFFVLKFNFLTLMLCKIGKVSYFIYFCHFLVLRFASYFVGDLCNIENQLVLFLCVFTVSIGISFLLATLSMKYIEKPFMLLVK
jgi:peptidoglycan/LPS O-acetylase OafA/YrhL